MMLEFTRLEKEIQKSAKEFARGEFDRDDLLCLAKKREFPLKQLQKAARLGLLCVQLPEKYGGEGLGISDQAVILEALAFQDSTAGFALASAFLGAGPVIESGNSGLIETFVTPVARGESLCAPAFFETDVQAAAPRFMTTAGKKSAGWVINGTKTNVLNADLAQFFIVICDTGSSKGSSLEGCTLFLVEKGTGGITIKDQGPRLGMGMVSSSTLHFCNARVPFSHVIGEAGQGMERLKAFQCSLWILVASLAMGIAKGAYKRALDYIRQREQFGKKIAGFRINRHKVATLAVEMEAAGLAARKAALLYDGKDRRLEVSALARLLATDTAVRVCDEAVQLMGGYGYMTEYEVEHFLRDAKALSLMGGERAVLLDIIADREIGKI